MLEIVRDPTRCFICGGEATHIDTLQGPDGQVVSSCDPCEKYLPAKTEWQKAVKLDKR